MANVFSKEEKVAFDEMLAGFEDACTISQNVAIFNTDGVSMERSNDTIWRPQTYILPSKDRVIGSSTSKLNVKQLSVPSTLGFQKVVPWNLSAKEMRDAMQEGRLQKAASQRLASDINTAVRDNVSLQGTLVSAISGVAGTYDDVATCESLMNETGVMTEDRYLGLTTRDYNGLAGNLAGRQTLETKTLTAYERSMIGVIAGFDAYKLDTGTRLAANGATVTIDTTGSQINYVPLSSESTTAGKINVDNRYQQVTVSTTTGVAAGDAFTIAGIENVHMIEKGATSQLKTFRVISVDSGSTMTISPPIISASSSPTDPELQYKNAEAVSTSAIAAVTFLNQTATYANPFWYKDSIELLPGRYSVPGDQGVDVLRATTKQGIEVVMTKKFDPDTFESEFYVDSFWGVVNNNPEMNGVLLFNQP